MKLNEVIEEITSKPKWYWTLYKDGNYRPNSTVFMTAKEIIKGKAKPQTVKRFLNRFGYDVDIKYEITKRGN